MFPWKFFGSPEPMMPPIRVELYKLLVQMRQRRVRNQQIEQLLNDVDEVQPLMVEVLQTTQRLVNHMASADIPPDLRLALVQVAETQLCVGEKLRDICNRKLALVLTLNVE